MQWLTIPGVALSAYGAFEGAHLFAVAMFVASIAAGGFPAIARFGLGYRPGQWEWTSEWLRGNPKGGLVRINLRPFFRRLQIEHMLRVQN